MAAAWPSSPAPSNVITPRSWRPASLNINGTAHQFAAGISLLQALQQAGHDVPHLCHDDRLKPYGGCRMCLVEIDGETRR